MLYKIEDNGGKYLKCAGKDDEPSKMQNHAAYNTRKTKASLCIDSAREYLGLGLLLLSSNPQISFLRWCSTLASDSRKSPIASWAKSVCCDVRFCRDMLSRSASVFGISVLEPCSEDGARAT